MIVRCAKCGGVIQRESTLEDEPLFFASELRRATYFCMCEEEIVEESYTREEA